MSVHFRAVELHPDLSCLWKLLGDACTAVTTVSPNRAQVLVPAPLAGLDCSTQGHMLNQAQTLKVGERYDPTQGHAQSSCHISVTSIQCSKNLLLSTVIAIIVCLLHVYLCQPSL